MAKVQREPTAKNRKTIEALFEKLLNGDAIFVSIKAIQSWYGRNSETSAKKFKKFWNDYCENNADADRLEIGLMIGELSKPKGYVVVREDRALWVDEHNEPWLTKLSED